MIIIYAGKKVTDEATLSLQLKYIVGDRLKSLQWKCRVLMKKKKKKKKKKDINVPVKILHLPKYVHFPTWGFFSGPWMLWWRSLAENKSKLQLFLLLLRRGVFSLLCLVWNDDNDILNLFVWHCISDRSPFRGDDTIIIQQRLIFFFFWSLKT